MRGLPSHWTFSSLSIQMKFQRDFKNITDLVSDPES